MDGHDERELISAYLDGALEGAERAGFEAHLGGCASCRGGLAELRAVKAVLAGAPRRAMPPELLARLERRFERPAPFGGVRRFFERPLAWIPAAAAAAIVVSTGLWLGLGRPAPVDDVPLEPLLAAHARYSSESLVPQTDMFNSEFSAHLAVYNGEQD